MRINHDIIKLYDEYTHAPLARRVFIKRLALLVGGTAAAYALLPLLENNYAQAAVVAEDDPRLSAESIAYPGARGELRGYLVKPKDAAGKLPAVIVIHENRGLNAHIQDVARRVALAGYVVLGPDLLSGAGGTPSDEDKARELIGALAPQRAVADLRATLAYLKNHPDSTGKVGAVGFCWGGGMVNQLAANAPDLGAGVVYYGRSPAAEQVTAMQAPLLLHYAGLDERINARVPDYEAALKAAGKNYALYRYEGAEHAFNNDTNAARYNAGAAKLAWERTLAFFAEHLKS